MARNEEKAQALLNRFVAAKTAANKDDKSVRPYLASECEDVADCERYRNQIIKEISKKVSLIQNEGLEEHKVRVPQSLRRPFTLLHSYMLVKKLVRRDDHAGAARMLLRVAVSISKFPSHKVPILTSTVIECTRAGLKASALEYAMQLMRPEYRQHVDPKYKRKIEGLVRRPKGPNPEEEFSPLSPCPISSQLIPITSLECPTTKDAIPMYV